MKTKTLLAILGLVTTQSFFYSCNDDNSQTESPSGIQKSKTESPGSFVSTQNYFANPEPFNGALNFITTHISAQGTSYTLTQNDLDLFYAKAQIPVNERLTIDQVNQLINQTINSAQLPFDQIVQQLTISDAAKSLMISINSNYISNIESNLDFKNLPDNEKVIINNFNDLEFNIEQGTILAGTFQSKEMGPGAQNGAKIGFAFGCLISVFTLNPGPVCAGAIIGGAIGSLWDK
ncbi:hypothetical protein [Chryseobacterium populi]|uniref:Uncharacterized protein n=1 Tax=Chryseobacterium populi TaxID=1144316 RepID=J2KFA5_9FLAO|nr:hypothetical protein [Chryseobacterium populi]EJL71823.1 hypothetical protein PMI13_02159 [Chryseobacterium populi]